MLCAEPGVMFVLPLPHIACDTNVVAVVRTFEEVTEPFDSLIKASLAQGNPSADGLAERVGFEPTCPLLAGKTLSRRPRYDHFGTSPAKNNRNSKSEIRKSDPLRGRVSNFEFRFSFFEFPISPRLPAVRERSRAAAERTLLSRPPWKFQRGD